MVADAYHKVTGMKLLDTYKKLPSAAEWPFIQELKALEYANHKWANSAVGAAVPELLASISDLDHAEQNKYDPMDFLWPDRGRINVLRVGKTKEDFKFARSQYNNWINKVCGLVTKKEVNPTTGN